MRRTHRRLALTMVPTLLICLVAAGCGGDADPPDSSGAADAADAARTAETTGDANDEDPRGTITVGAETWTFVADGQCDVHPMPLASIWGHMTEYPDREITIDFDPASEFVEAKIEDADGSVLWRSGNEDLEMSVEGTTVRGEGMFGESYGPATREGSFEVSC